MTTITTAAAVYTTTARISTTPTVQKTSTSTSLTTSKTTTTFTTTTSFTATSSTITTTSTTIPGLWPVVLFGHPNKLYQYLLGESVTVDPTNGDSYYSFGYQRSDLDLRWGGWNVSAGSWGAAIVMKITRYGHIEWVQKLGGGATDTEISAFEDTVLSSDRQYLYGVGRFTLGDFPGEHTATIGNISLRMDGCMPTGSGALLVKMRADTGEVVYARIINADYCGDTYGHAICLDAANNIYVVGEYYPKTNWTFAGTKLTENGPFILKYDANFVEKWITTPMTNAYGWFCTYDADKSRVAWGGYYINKTNNPAMGVWGHYTAGKDPIATLSNGTVINGPTGIAELGFLVSTDPTNGATKAVSFGNRHNDIVKHGNYYYTPGTVHIETAEHPLRAGIVTKVDSTTLQPVKEWIVEGDGKVNGKAITVDSSGNVYFAGTTKALSVSAIGATNVTNTCVVGGSGALAAFVGKIDAATNAWSIFRCDGGVEDGSDTGWWRIAADPDNTAFYATGWSLNSYIQTAGKNYTSITADNFGAAEVQNYGFTDIMVGKFDMSTLTMTI